jgi:hypothetical protein
MRRCLLALCGALTVAGCGSTTASPAGGGGAPASSSAAAGSGASLTVTGSLSVTVNETSNSANRCQRGSGGIVSGILTFDTYSLQFGLGPGTTSFPNTAGTSVVAFFNNNDSTKEWSIGSRQTATAAGTVTLAADGKSGTVDVDMLPNPPRPNPALQPIHVKGTFTCV